jgi:hypothetical protein
MNIDPVENFQPEKLLTYIFFDINRQQSQGHIPKGCRTKQFPTRNLQCTKQSGAALRITSRLVRHFPYLRGRPNRDCQKGRRAI